MADFDLVKIDDVSEYRREFIEISDTEEYKRCRVQLHKKGVVLRDIIKGSDIKTKKQRLCKTNDFIVAEMDAKFGGYGIIPESLNNAIVSSHYYLFELNQNKILPDYLKVLIDSDVIQSQIKAKGTTNYSRVSPKEILNFEIPCPSIDVQKKIIRKYINSKKHVINILKESDTQQFFLKQLRQSILQEAVEGKLTAQWRKQHPDLISGENHAARLLEKIKAEKKKKLTKNTKNTKKFKELPPVSEEEKPFDLPEGWVWCRLGGIINLISGQHIETHLYNYERKGFPYLTGPADFGKIFPKINKWTEHPKVFARKNDILITVKGSGVGKINIVNFEKIVISRQLMAIRNIAMINSYLYLFLQNYFNILQSLRKGLIPGIGRDDILLIPFALPSLTEQQAIVEKVDRLMAKIDALEEQVKNRKAQAEQLMQAVLREAFNGEE